MTKKQKIQRIRCKVCGRTTNLLPSFLLAQKSFQVCVFEEVVNLLINHSQDWKKRPRLPVDISKIYLWLRRFKEQVHESLPLLREKLLTLKPNTPIKTQSVPTGLVSEIELFQQFLNVAQLLHQTTISLLKPQPPEDANVFSFLNYFLAQHTGKALLEI
jgi:hypothetical protein